MHIEITLKTGK